MNRKIKVVLLDSDKEYIESFNEYLKEKIEISYSIILFTDISALDVFCKTERVDMIIIAEYLLSDTNVKECINSDENVVILVEDKETVFINGMAVIYRYQPIELLISSVLNVCAEKIIRKRSQIEYKKVKKKCIVGVYSPIGRCGKTSLAINLGIGLSQRNLKILLINLEEFSLITKYFNIENIENISDLLYYYLSGRDALDIKSEAIIKNYRGLDYIPPVQYMQDLRKTDISIWKDFIDSIIEAKEYDVVIIDMSSMVADVFEMLSLSDIIIIPTIDDENSRYKIKSFQEFIEKSKYDISLTNSVFVNMNEVNEDIDNAELKSLMIKIENFLRGGRDIVLIN